LSATIDRIRDLVATGKVRVSEHGYDELAADGLTAREIVAGIGTAELIEDYPDYAKGPSILVLQRDAAGKPVHVVWGIPKGYTGPAVLVTAYRPDPEKWDAGFIWRRQ
jgi:Domain of unknown function (DUF4258)